VSALRVASFTVHATAAQSARWKQAAEAEGFSSAGAWLACAADAYLKARVRAGAPVPLAWRRGVFKVQLVDGEEQTMRGRIAEPFGEYRGDGTGHDPKAERHTLVYLPTRRILATVKYQREVRALAAELARTWVRGKGPEPAGDPLADLRAARGIWRDR
jgi:hypothetical protein